MICTKTKQWGNSIGIIIPKDVVKEMNIKPNDEICVDIERKKNNILVEFFGSGKTKIDTEKVLKDIRRNESKFI